MKVITTGCLLLAILAMQGACFRTRQEVQQLDAVSYIQFTGKTENSRVVLKQGQTPVWSLVQINPGSRYSVKPGTYDIEVIRQGKTVVRRQIFLADLQTFEVRVP